VPITVMAPRRQSLSMIGLVRRADPALPEIVSDEVLKAAEARLKGGLSPGRVRSPYPKSADR
jgi:hypothetical protein